MSNINQFDFFNFYTRYKWTTTDFEDFEQTLAFLTKALGRRNPGAVLRGFQFASATGFNISVADGLAVDANGFPLHKSGTTSSIGVSAPGPTEGRWSLVVARKTTSDINSIIEPTNPNNSVFLNTREEALITVIDGTAAVNPSYPSKLAGDVILFGIKMPAAASDIQSDYIDYSVTEYPFVNGDDAKYFKRFDAVVGKGRFTTHQSLNDVMADADIANIRDILIAESDTLNEVQTIDQANKRIYFKAGVSYTKGTAATGIEVTAQGVDIERGRFVDFDGGSDIAIGFASGANYGSVFGTRFNNCDTDVLDDTSIGISILGTQTEA